MASLCFLFTNLFTSWFFFFSWDTSRRCVFLALQPLHANWEMLCMSWYILVIWVQGASTKVMNVICHVNKGLLCHKWNKVSCLSPVSVKCEMSVGLGYQTNPNPEVYLFSWVTLVDFDFRRRMKGEQPYVRES